MPHKLKVNFQEHEKENRIPFRAFGETVHAFVAFRGCSQPITIAVACPCRLAGGLAFIANDTSRNIPFSVAVVDVRACVVS